MKKWLLMVYKIPREPTAGRVYVWRKMKQLGAVSLQDAAWVLPATPRTQEQFQWLASEIDELGGEATYWLAEMLYESRDDALVRQFEAPLETAYREILAGLKQKKRDLAALAKRFQETQSRDYFHSELGTQVREKLLAAQEGRKR
ncbi:MAG: ChrB protein [Planctomycetes bacterium]|nr:ChrB protein [Planctomycetota bacterium]